MRGGSLGTRSRLAKEVSALREAQSPGELDLAKAEKGRSSATAVGVYPPFTLIAYLLGAIGTMGSGIWLMWLIS